MTIKLAKVVIKPLFREIFSITNHKPLTKAKSLQQGKCGNKVEKTQMIKMRFSLHDQDSPPNKISNK